MAQGKEFTTEQRQEIMQSLKPYLELGFSRNKACDLIGLPPTTLSNWAREDEALGMKLEGWENAMNKTALANIQTAMIKETEDGKADTAKWWAERKMKHDFSLKLEQDITSDGKAITWNEQRTYLDETIPKTNTGS